MHSVKNITILSCFSLNSAKPVKNEHSPTEDFFPDNIPWMLINPFPFVNFLNYSLTAVKSRDIYRFLRQFVIGVDSHRLHNAYHNVYNVLQSYGHLHSPWSAVISTQYPGFNS